MRAGTIDLWAVLARGRVRARTPHSALGGMAKVAGELAAIRSRSALTMLADCGSLSCAFSVVSPLRTPLSFFDHVLARGGLRGQCQALLELAEFHNRPLRPCFGSSNRRAAPGSLRRCSWKLS
jgi:hypothetical protein